MPIHSNRRPQSPTSASPRYATLPPNTAAATVVKDVLSDAPTEIATPSAPSVRDTVLLKPFGTRQITSTYGPEKVA
jgi:BarA-like signal transduction histidine kinase